MLVEARSRETLGSVVSQAARRFAELSVAVIGLVCLTPLLLIIALAIKIDDGGNVFYSQARVGRGFKTFRLLKFRTMVPDADRAGELTCAEDVRVTRVGRSLRRWKLDEIPQLINIVLGEMQFVGPRPEIERFVDLFRGEYEQLLIHPPGITDPASIAFREEESLLTGTGAEYFYISSILPAKLRFSIEYAGSRNLLTDIKTILLTVGSIALGPGKTTRAAHPKDPPRAR